MPDREMTEETLTPTLSRKERKIGDLDIRV